MFAEVKFRESSRMGPREVVVTGMGLITPIGGNIDENWDSLKAMKTGIAHYPNDALPKYMQYMGRAGEFEPDGNIPHKLLGQLKFLNRGSVLGFVAAREAIMHSGISNDDDISPGRKALYIASGDTTKVGYDFMSPAIKDGTKGGWQEIDAKLLNQSALDKVNPFFLVESISNNLFSFLSAFLGFMGSNTSLASHSPSGGNALELAYRSIRHGKADIAMAVGCGNWITEIPLYEMDGLGLLSGCRQGINSFRPFDKKRDGFIPGEGGAAILLESSELAEKRGAVILGKIRGFGNCMEISGNKGISVPTEVTSRCMKLSLEDAECGLEDLAFISPHGSGSQKGDRSELKSILVVCEGKRNDIQICGMKPYTGHLGAASDIAEIIFGIKSVAEGFVPATLNFNESEKEFEGIMISGTHQPCDKKHFLSTSYGIGGQSSSVVVSVV